jgi:hypothetical protein
LSTVVVLESMVAGWMPKVTAVAPTRFVPVIFTRVPEASGPDAGEMSVMTGGGNTTTGTLTVCPSTTALTVAVPATDGVNVVVFAPDSKDHPDVGAKAPLPDENTTGMPSGTWPEAGSWLIPFESYVRLARIVEDWPKGKDAGVAVTLSTSHEAGVKPTCPEGDGLLFVPHQLLSAVKLAPLTSGSLFE